MKMYSTNGRKKVTDKEQASDSRSFKSDMVCNDCGHVTINKAAVFGEVSKCPECLSTDVRFDYK